MGGKASILGELRTAVEEAGARLLIISVPLQYQIDDDLWNRMCARHGLDAADFDRGASARRMDDIAAALEVAHLDLAGPLAREPDVAALYFAINKHFTAAGHEAAARAIAEYLIRERLLDG